jgi:hypothetical protein
VWMYQQQTLRVPGAVCQWMILDPATGPARAGAGSGARPLADERRTPSESPRNGPESQFELSRFHGAPQPSCSRSSCLVHLLSPTSKRQPVTI